MPDAVGFFDNLFQHLFAKQLPDLNPFEQRSVVKPVFSLRIGARIQ